MKGISEVLSHIHTISLKQLHRLFLRKKVLPFIYF